MPETPEEHHARLRVELAQRAHLFKQLVAEFGPSVLDVVARNTADSAQQFWQALPLPRRDLDAVLAMWQTASAEVEYTLEEQSPGHLKMHATRCFWADVMRGLDAADIGYAFYCAYDEGYCRGLNPALRFTRTQTLMQGDDCCDHTYDLDAEH